MICSRLARNSPRAVVLPIAELQNLLTQHLQLRVFSRLPSIEEANAVGSPPMPPTLPARPTVNHPT